MAAALIAGTLLLYWPAAGFDFVSFDDGVYVVNNDHLNQGFSRAGLAWCFQAGYASNWHPLTWMSHMLDCQLFGLRSGPPHVVNILLHAADSVLLFLVLKRLTGAFWRSGMVAALFAWHPLHVESVAWVSERKDVLSALFWMLTLLAYVRYADGLRLQNLKAKFYLRLALLFFALGLMAKPMLVTLPCVLLLLDWWPLQRMGPIPLKHFSQLLAEKASFFLLAACSGVLTLLAQSMNDSVASLKFISLSMRLWNGAVGYLRYLEKMFWPAHLSVIYPLVFKLPGLEVVLGVGCLAGISAMAVISRKNRPYFLAGWLWYLITLLPVIGLVQVGGQSMADRYSYLPSIGVFIIVCWAATDLTRQWAGRRAFLLLISAVTLTACAFRTRAQLGCWQDTRTLFQNAIAVDPDNYIAHSSYGNYLQSLGQLEPARLECQRAVEIMPAYVLGYTCLSSVLEAQGRTNEAITTLRDGLKIRPDFSDARCELAKLLFDNDRNVEAETELEAGLKIDAAAIAPLPRPRLGRAEKV